MANWLIAGGPRQQPCYFQNEGVLITSLGDVYSCSITDKKLGSLREQSATKTILSSQAIAIRESVKNSDCINCIHDQTGAWAPLDLIIEQLRKTRVMHYQLQLQKLIGAGTDIILGTLNRHLPVAPQQSNKHALFIGAYGGEHVGDAAILGGVVQRLVNEYKLESISVASFRPDRTLMWISMLDLPIEVEVIPYTHKAINQQLPLSGYVVYAGGPLMELPAQLARHLAVLSKARKKGARLIIEGVGLGPLFTFYSKSFVKSMLRISDSVSIRTRIDKVRELLPADKRILEVRDPAYDYLESRTLDAINTCSSKQSVDKFTANATLRIGINLRPLWEKYNFDVHTTTDQLEKEYLTTLAAAMLTLQNQHGQKLSFFFFPMNSDQFGMSDLNTAYQLESMLDKSINYLIWEAEPDVDSTLYYMNKMDVILSMRFHGCIFAMTHCQNRLIGIDYQIGKTGKVTQLMQENELEENCLSVSTLNSDLVVDKLNSMLGSNQLHRV